MKDLDYYKNNCMTDYRRTPTSVLRYITELEKKIVALDNHSASDSSDMTPLQKSTSLTLFLMHLSNKMGDADVMRINMFAMDFVGSAADSPEKIRAMGSYSSLPFSMDDDVCNMLINHPCEPLKQ